ncbi:MAG TPA: RNA-binding protein [Burkholderiales bacterium]|nr:RNA-binding protein [Burkholderiales bacterium]
MKLWIGNLAPETSDADLNAFLQRYGLPPCTAIQRVAGDGSRPGALVSFVAIDDAALYHAALRLDGVYWNRHSLNVLVLQRM